MNPIKVFETTSMTQAVATFFFRPARFNELATLYDAGYSLSHGEDLRQRFEAGTYDPITDHHRSMVADRASAVRHSFLKAGALVGASVVLAAVVRVVAKGWPSSAPSVQNLLQLVGAAILLWSTVWQIGWGIRSIGGETLSERVHNATFRTMAFVGTFLFVVAYLW
jgi:hypothetical protein